MLPEQGAYNIPLALRLTGPLDATALEAGLRSLVQRHEALRTTFRWEEGALRQVIAPTAAIPLDRHDLGHLAAEAREAALGNALRAGARRPFHLGEGPLLRASLHRLAPEDHVLGIVMHHIISDAWSLEVLVNDWKAFYRAALEGLPPALPALGIQGADLDAWRRERLQGAVLEGLLAYWTRKLEGAPPLLDLPLDRDRPGVASLQGASTTRRVEPALLAQIRSLARGEGATLFMVLLAALKGLLARVTGQEDLVVGTPVAGRDRPEAEPLVGFLVNTLALRTDLSGDPALREILARVRATVREGLQHQDLPFDRVVEALNPPRSRSHSPLFQVSLALQPAAARAGALPGLAEEQVDIAAGFAPFDLAWSAAEDREGLVLRLDYAADLFEAGTARRLMDLYLRMLEAFASAPERPLSLVPLLDEAERRQLEAWNDTGAAIPDGPVQACFEVQAARRPAAPAVALGDRVLGYGELNERANRVAEVLIARGVGPEVTVGLFMEPCLELVAGILGILKAGGAYVPLPPDHPEASLRFMIGDAGVRLILAGPGLAARLPDTGATVFEVDLDGLAGGAPNPPLRSGSEDLAYVMYTSGSTGRPKGVEVLHRGIVRLVHGQACVDLGPGTRTLLASPLAFDASTFELWAPLLHGGLCALLPEARPSPAGLRDAIARHGVETLWLTSALFNAVVQEAPDCLRGVRQLLVGGEALSVRHVRMAQDRLPDLRIVNGYGPTEATTFSCCHPIPHPLPEGLRSIPIGRPIANSTAHVLGPRGELQPVGVAGELHVGGLGVARGYRNLPDLTAASFLPDPFRPGTGARLYRTGDRARWLPDGTLEFLGRFDAQVKIRGHRIEPEGVEAVLGRYPGLGRSAVDVRERRPGEKRLVAFLEVPPREDPAFNLEGLGAFLARNLPPHLVPDVFAIVPELPLRNGKVDRAALRTMPLAAAIPRRHVGPEDPTQMLLAQLWEDLLDVRPVGILDDFFELGGHSLLAFAMLARVEEAFGRRLPATALYTHATVQALARLLAEEAPEAPESPLAAVQAGDASRRPFFFLHGDYNGGGFYCRNLVRHLDPAQPFWAIHPYGLAGQPAPGPVEAMAEAHLSLLREVQPAGPYRLGGHCNGALEAYEMARQLRARGEGVELLLLMDPPDPDPTPLEALPDLEAAPSGLAALPPDQRQQVLFRRFLEVLRRYRPGALDVPAVFFRSGAEAEARGAGGWAGLVPVSQVHGFPGGHLSTLTRHVADMGRRLQACLDAVDGGGP